jgi:hypothetical protein
VIAYRLVTSRVPTLDKAQTIDPRETTITFNNLRASTKRKTGAATMTTLRAADQGCRRAAG